MTRLLDGSDAGELWPLVDEPTFYDEFLVEQDSIFAERDARDTSPQSPKAPVIPSPPRMAGVKGDCEPVTPQRPGSHPPNPRKSGACMSTKNIHRDVDGLQAHRDAALRWANEIRAERGMQPLDELPKGQRCDSRRCPLALATGLDIHFAFACELTAEGETFFDLPEDVRLFLYALANRKYPDLIEADS